MLITQCGSSRSFVSCGRQACVWDSHPVACVLIVVQYIRSPVATLCMGQAASMASLLLTAGEPGQRRSLPHTRIMMHQPSGGFRVSKPIVFALLDHALQRSSLTIARALLPRICCELTCMLGTLVMSNAYLGRCWLPKQTCKLSCLLLLQGAAADIAIHAQEILFLRRQLNKIYQHHTKQSIELLGVLICRCAWIPALPHLPADG